MVNVVRAYNTIPSRIKSPGSPPSKTIPMTFIPIHQTGGIGDLIVSLPFLDSFKDCPMPIKFFNNYPEIGKMFIKWAEWEHTSQLQIPNYEYYLVSSDVLSFKFKNEPAKDLLPAYLQPIYQHWLDLKPEWGEFIDNHPHHGNFMGRKAVNLGLKRWSLPFLFIDKPYKEFEFEDDFDEPYLENYRYITIHDGFDPHYRFEGRSMKSWPLENWTELINQFKRLYPEISIIQLGANKDKPLPGIDLDLVGKTTFEESLQYLKGALVHIDTCSGLVHARHLFKKPSIVIYGPTNHQYFGYPENFNVEPRACGNCWWQKGNWMEKCVLNHKQPLCMHSTTVNHILQVLSWLLPLL